MESAPHDALTDVKVTHPDTREELTPESLREKLLAAQVAGTVTFFVRNLALNNKTYTFVDEANGNQASHTFAPLDDPGGQDRWQLTLAIRPGASHGWMHYWSWDNPSAVIQHGWITNGEVINL
jgi:hypothetical protein